MRPIAGIRHVLTLIPPKARESTCASLRRPAPYGTEQTETLAGTTISARIASSTKGGMAMRRFGMRFALAFGLSTWLLFASVAAANTVVQWNAIALSTVIGAEQSPAARLRVMTLVHVAMFEALNFNQSRYRSELVVVPPQALKMAEAVIAASAARHVLVKFYPEWRTSLDNELRLILESTANEQDASSAKSLGAVIASNILAARYHDGVPRYLRGDFRGPTPMKSQGPIGGVAG